VLLAIWGFGRLAGTVLEHRDLRRFERAQQTAAAAPAVAHPSPPLAGDSWAVDQSQWAKERIRAYAQALTQPGPPPLAVLRIPRIGLEVPVLAGTDEWTLDRAVGWIEGTARPGESGNVGIAGHRDGFFRGLKDVKTGDSIELVTLTDRQAFRIEAIHIVSPNELRVLGPTRHPALTLVTCFPFYFMGSAPKRYIVRAVLSSAPAAAPTDSGVVSK
jgi:sortase A